MVTFLSLSVSLSLDLRLALRGDLERVVSKSMLGQLEQYEIVKGQIWQQYYSSIEEKVKSDWFMNLYKTINVLANPSQVSLILIDFSLTTSIDLVNNQEKQNNTMRGIRVLSILDLTYIDKRGLCSLRSLKTGVSLSKREITPATGNSRNHHPKGFENMFHVWREV